MNAKSILGSAAALAAIGVVGYAAMAQTGRAPAEVQLPTINQSTAREPVENPRECEAGRIDSACVYL